MKTNLISKIGVTLLFPTLALSLLLLSPRLFSNGNSSDTKVIAQDTTLQDSLIIIGKVVDLDHLPLEGVVIKDSNSNMETLTDIDGMFDLSFDMVSEISFTKNGFSKVDHKIIKSDSNLVVIMSPESNELILQGFGSSVEKGDNMEWMEIDTTSTLRKKYDLMNDSIENRSTKMDKWVDKMDSIHMNKRTHIHDSLKNMNNDKWNKEMKHDMDTTKVHKPLNSLKNDTTKKMMNIK